MRKKNLLQIPSNLFVLLKLDFLMRFFNRGKVTILTYHGISDASFSGVQNYDAKHVHIDRFKEQLVYLMKYYHIIPLDKFLNSAKLPPNSLILTFDDGYKNNFTHLFPILKENKTPATIFLTSGIIGSKKINWTDKLEGAIDNAKIDKLEMLSQTFNLSTKKDKTKTVIELKRFLRQKTIKERDILLQRITNQLKWASAKIHPDYQILNWKEIKLMFKESISFGSHTKTHAILTKTSEEELRKELEISKKEIEAGLKNKINAITYPNGYYNKHVIEVAKEYSYICGLTTEYGLNSIDSNKFKLKRISVNDSYSLNFFIANLHFNFNEFNSFISRAYINLKRLFS